MAQQPQPAATDQGNLLRFERVGKGTAVIGDISAMIGRSPFFAEFSREDIDMLSEYMDVYRAQPGEIIIREGDGGDFMLLVLEGSVDILKRDARGEQRHMTTVGPGMTLGEMSMIDGEPRFATCLATTTVLFAVLNRDNMAKIILDQPGLGAKVLIKFVTMLSLRLRQTSARLLEYMEGLR
jgi:CRP/FNR family cyclic AMP-dependent transcriptional regulator